MQLGPRPGLFGKPGNCGKRSKYWEGLPVWELEMSGFQNPKNKTKPKKIGERLARGIKNLNLTMELCRGAFKRGGGGGVKKVGRGGSPAQSSPWAP